MKKFFIVLGIALFSISAAQAQTGSSQRIPLIGTRAPSFKAPSTNGMISFPSDFQGKWKILFAHPRDFTPVCSSEILDLAYHQQDFKALNAQIIVLSVDRLVSHRSWKADLESIDFRGRGKVNIDFPLVVDSSYSISYKYGMVDPQSESGQSVRGIFFIDPENTVRAFQFYPNEVGRNTGEIIRTLQALQAHDEIGDIVLPANWKPGDDYMKANLTPEDKKELHEEDPDIYYINWYMIYKKSQTGGNEEE
jgi:peroxiredoxin (alkyl hydroperoxide reductase subunit C)